jgi:hypothetical protein
MAEEKSVVFEIINEGLRKSKEGRGFRIF